VPGNLRQWNIGLRPGTTAAAYTRAVDDALGSHSPFQATGPDGGQFYVIAIGLIGLLSLMVAVAAGLGVLNTATLHAMAATAHTRIPAQFTDVFPAPRLALLSLAAVAIAVLGALPPATWAARARPATALRAE
jgi:hypothetical protein